MTARSCAHTLSSAIPHQTSLAEDRTGGHCKAAESSRAVRLATARKPSPRLQAPDEERYRA
jgi:hypothetical protein